MPVVFNEFYCINCGNKGIDLARRKGHQHKAGHRKKLYCIYCKQTCNHYECPNPIDTEKFKIKFKNGDFIEEAKESLKECAKETFL